MGYSRSYNPKNVSVIIGHGFNMRANTVLTGFAEGTFVNCEKTTENVTPVTGGQGDVTQVLNHDETGTVTVTLKITSPALSLIRHWARSGEELFVSVSDSNQHSRMAVSGRGRVAKPPAESRGSSIESVDVVFALSQYNYR